MGAHSHLSTHLPDIQTTADTRKVFIREVGVSNIKIPLLIYEKPIHPAASKIQRTVGEVSMHVSLSMEKKGVHMSRFTELLNSHTGNQKTFSMDDLIPLAVEMLVSQEAEHAALAVSMDFFREVLAPETKIPGVAPCRASLRVEATKTKVRIWTGVVVTGQTCCPCSKEISDFDPAIGKGRGAHSQHGHVDILVENDPASIIWFEDLIEIANHSVSAPAHPILKRVDERHATISAYENPKFVEDVLRDAAVQLRDLPGIYSFRVQVTNDEVIHFHTATGKIEEEIPGSRPQKS